MGSLTCVLVVLAAQAAAFGCHNAPRAARQEPDRRAPPSAPAIQVVARELEHRERGEQALVATAEDARIERSRSNEPQADASSFAHERAAFRRILRTEIRWLDRQVSILQAEHAAESGAAAEEKQQEVDAAREWQRRLRSDLDALERTGAEDWADVRARIERDLEDDKPEAIPRSYEKSYAI